LGPKLRVALWKVLFVPNLEEKLRLSPLKIFSKSRIVGVRGIETASHPMKVLSRTSTVEKPACDNRYVRVAGFLTPLGTIAAILPNVRPSRTVPVTTLGDLIVLVWVLQGGSLVAVAITIGIAVVAPTSVAKTPETTNRFIVVGNLLFMS
jgi:hypothetical protein